MKKLFAAFLAITLLFSPIGNFIFNDSPVAEAKRYKSGKKNFNIDKQKQQPNQSNIQKQKENDNKNNTVQNNKKPSTGGGLMKGLLVGGLAGLLFGSLFANMGMLGSVLGFLINAFAIIILVVLIKKVFNLLSARKKEEDARPWNR
ncbi:hypothetical protein [Sporosarcina ureilytica]|uniref:Preprotein translocase subunit Tim44 n=1 Tax=Sporosarcina ureilytica TaxID=298596 RepID=A0A1D8JHK4_9BACL|nr:hypothetical protein [Sporosarcina ureilytica]AOV08176.1 preprotein translocase subunit Tim44 [Sporosarcina ureilytica]